MIRRILSRFGTPIFFLVVLIAFIVALSVISSGHPKDWNETTGVIRKIETEVEYDANNDRREINHVYVEYTVDGTKYDQELGVYMPSYTEGMELKILVDPANPRSITAADIGPILRYFKIGIPIAAVLFVVTLALAVIRKR